MPHIQIGKRRVGPGQPVYVIAEMSGNHNQDFDVAVKIVEAAAACGADAVKLQTYTADTMTIASDRPEFRVGPGTLWEGQNLYDLYTQAHTPWAWQRQLRDVAVGLGLDFFSTAFDPAAVDFLEDLQVPVHKVASFEIVDLPLIEKMARTGKPMIISTGMSSLEEIEEAVKTARAAGARQIALLKCTSAYPAAPEDMNLLTIPHLADTFGTPVGLSDHTMGTTVPVAAVAVGACIVEKHFTLSRATPGPDSAFSLEPAELKEMVSAIRVAEKSLGGVKYGSGAKEENSKVFRRSLFVVKAVKAGDLFTAENIRAIRPGFGMHTRHLGEVLGKHAGRDIAAGTPMNWELISS
ncbi:MAG TPA: pseudaminic acid synthase [Polyangia bacterium]|nr:pseudaminic acid synthase [Polyangia bacterium]